jgi:anion-transporting  ArsA/GET3 family ATPase
MGQLWGGCQDRLTRFEEVLRKMRKDGVADLQEMPNTIRGVAKSLYLALRRADIITEEISATESGMLSRPPVWNASTQDAQSKELYRIADKNIAEYRTQFAGVLAGVQRTEAQSAVFMTTLDSLRMKLIGYRLVGRNPSMHSEEFLEAIAEAKLQLQSIDTALDELDLGHYPKNISVIPPLPPEEQIRINQN